MTTRKHRSAMTAPGHIVAAGIIGKPVDFEWDDDDPYPIKESPQIRRLLAPLSVKAGLALAAGVAEWIIWRLDGLGEFPDALQFIEAVWAGVADLQYVDEWELSDAQDLSGPSLSARLEAVFVLDQALANVKILDRPNEYTRRLTFMAQHVLRGNKAYKKWLEQAVERLTALSPMSELTQALFRDEFELDEDDDASEHYGTPVARAMLDTTVPFDPARNAELIDEFLRGLDPAKNRYLVPIKTLRKSGFEGAPYRFPAQ